MSIGDIVVSLIVIALIVAVILHFVHRKKQGKSIGCNCDSCPKGCCCDQKQSDSPQR